MKYRRVAVLALALAPLLGGCQAMAQDQRRTQHPAATVVFPPTASPAPPAPPRATGVETSPCATPDDKTLDHAPLPNWVADQADLLPPPAEQQLTRRLIALQEQTGHPLVVVTLSSLEGLSVDQAGLLLANCWAVGRKGHDDGALILVAPNERRVRIELGYGLERYIPDARAAKIIETDITPHFVKGDYAAGIEAGTAAMIAELKRVPKDTRADAAAARQSRLSAKPSSRR